MTTQTVPVRTQADAIALLEETVAFYGADPQARRAVEYGVCKYVTTDGRSCAVGRCLADPSAVQARFKQMGISIIVEKEPDYDNLFKVEYRGFPLDLWFHLQALHDNSSYWGTTGLSAFGVTRKEDVMGWIRRSDLPA